MVPEYIEIKTKQGNLKGVVKRTAELSNKTYYSFQGIPYAKPPVGKLRFKVAEPYGQWEGTRDATKEGNDSLQNHFVFGNIVGDEDCLYVNVYTAQLGGDSKKAVMVWIHGGGFICGSGSSEFYGPDFLIEEDIVLVTINYRCGVLGFLSLENEKLPGNLGLKDQTMALRWVQEYIDSFGGDPNNVTIFGESAGGASVHYHLLSPLSRGLFHKAIIQSGFSVCPWAFQNKPKEKALLLAKELGCTSQDEDEVLEFFMSVSATDIVKTQEKTTFASEKDQIQAFTRQFKPCIEVAGDDPFLSDYPRMVMQRGDFSKVPIIMGIVEKEGLLALALREIWFEEVNANLSSMVPSNLDIPMGSSEEQKLGKEILEFYTNEKSLSWDVMHGFINYISDIAFVNGLNMTRHSFLNQMACPVYSYKFSYTSPRAISSAMIAVAYPDQATEFIGCGAGHCDELVHLFKTNIPQVPFVSPTDDDQILMIKLLKAWTTFAKTGNPNCKELGVNWNPDSIQNPCYLNMGKVWETVDSTCFPKRMEFWKEIYEKYSYSY